MIQQVCVYLQFELFLNRAHLSPPLLLYPVLPLCSPCRKYGKAIEFTNQTSRAASSRLRDKGVAVSSSKQGSAGQSNSTGADKPKAASTSPEPSSSAS